MAFGVLELLVLVGVVVGPLTIGWALVDILMRGRGAWEAVGESRTAWLAVILVASIVFLPAGIVLSVIYLCGTRRKLMRVLGLADS